MLDVKLANYRPFIELMDAAGGGMFVTASDDIEASAVSIPQNQESFCLPIWKVWNCESETIPFSMPYLILLVTIPVAM